MDCFYLDGGLSDQFPIMKGVSVGKNVVGLHLNVSKRNLQDNPEEDIIPYFLKLLQVPIVQSVEYKINQAKATSEATIIPIVIDDVISMIKFDVKNKRRLEMFSIGYRCVSTYIENKIA